MNETILAIFLAGLRISGVQGEAFQAVSHLFVGGLFVAWRASNGRFFEWQRIKGESWLDSFVWSFSFWYTGKPLYFYLFSGLCLVETVCFFAVR